MPCRKNTTPGYIRTSRLHGYHSGPPVHLCWRRRRSLGAAGLVASLEQPARTIQCREQRQRIPYQAFITLMAPLSKKRPHIRHGRQSNFLDERSIHTPISALNQPFGGRPDFPVTALIDCRYPSPPRRNLPRHVPPPPGQGPSLYRFHHPDA